jgi:hypothetical protein
MGTGCESVRRVSTAADTIVVEGIWSGGRKGKYREAKGYGGIAKGEKGMREIGSYDGYRALLVEVVRFFRSGEAPVAPEETIELFAFMEAADESKRRDGERVDLKEVYARHGYQPPEGE